MNRRLRVSLFVGPNHPLMRVSVLALCLLFSCQTTFAANTTTVGANGTLGSWVRRLEAARIRRTPPQLQTGQELPRVFVTAPSDVRRPLELAARAVAEQDYATAAALLGELLIRAQDEDFFLPAESGQSTLVSVKNQALIMVGNLPPRGKELYQLRFGIEAANQLEAAVAAGDREALQSVAERYFHTEAGYRAMLLVGRDLLQRLELNQAERCFSRLLPFVAPDSLIHLEASQLLCIAQLMQGKRDAAASVFDELSRLHRGRFIELADERIRLTPSQTRESPAFLRFADALLAGATSSGASSGGASPPGAGLAVGFDSQGTDSQGTDSADWLVFRGDSSRNATSGGGRPLIAPLWRVPVADADDEQMVTALQQSFETDRRPPIPIVKPILVGRFVIMRTPEHLLGVDVESGKRVWPWPWDDSLFGQDPLPDTLNALSVNDRTTQLQQRLWEDSIHGQISSDGRAIYFVDGLGYATSSKVTIPGGGAPNQRTRALTSRETNHLVALQVVDEFGESVQGKLLWRVGDEDGFDNPALAGHFFLGPPLPLDGVLYAIAELNGELQLVAISADEGALLWRQQLGSTDEVGQVNLSGIRRLAGATPSYSNGILLCPTAAGALVAIDPTTRSLLWGFQCPLRNRRPVSSFAPNQYQREETSVGERWADGNPIVADGKIYFSPIESNELYCLDLKLGTKLWSRPRGSGIYIAGAIGSSLVVVASDRMQGLNLNDGRVRWNLPLDEHQRPSGYGYGDERFYYFPTVGRDVLQVDCQNGTVLRTSETDRRLGNLISINGRIISHGNDFVSAYYQDSAADRDAEARLAQDPNDPLGLALSGQLLLQQDRWSEALEAFARCVANDPSEIYSELLVTSLLKGLRDQQPDALGIAKRFEAFALASPRSAEYRQLVVESLIGAGRLAAAFEQLLDLVEQENSPPNAGQLERVGHEGRFIRHNRWVQSIGNRIMREVDENQRTELKARLTEFEQRVLSSENGLELIRYYDTFGSLCDTDAVRLRVARALFDDANWLRASLEYHQLSEHSEPQLRAAGLAGLTACYSRTGHKQLATSYLNDLIELAPWEPVWDGLQPEQLFETFGLEPQTSNASAPNWQDGQVTVVEGGDVIGRLAFPVDDYPFHCRQEQTDQRVLLRIDHNRHYEAVFQDRYGREITKLPLRASDGNVLGYFGTTMHTSEYYRLHSLVVLVSGYDVLGIDLTKLEQDPAAALIWRYSLLPDVIPDPNRPTSQRVNTKGMTSMLGWNVRWSTDTNWNRLGAASWLTSSGFCLIDQQQLVCIDPLTGKSVWKRGGMERGSDCTGNGELVAVIDKSYSRSAVYRVADGSLVDEAELQVGGNILTRHRGNLLSFDSTGREIRIRLTDCISRQDLLDETYPIGSRAAPVGSDEFAILTPDGLMQIFSLQDGSMRFAHEYELPDNIQSFRIAQDTRGWLLIVNRNDPTASSIDIGTEDSFMVSNSSPIGTFVNGLILSISPESGEPTWEQAVEVEQFCVPNRFVLDSTLLPLMRHHRSLSERGDTPFHTEVAVLDRSDGSLLMHRHSIPQSTSMMNLSGDPESHTMKLKLDQKHFTFEFAPTPRAPGAPANLRYENLYPTPAEETPTEGDADN